MIRFSSRRLLSLVTLVATLLGSLLWLFSWPSIRLSSSDLKQEREIPLYCEDLPHSLSIEISGEIDGFADLTRPWGTSTTIGPGRFKLIDGGDYYENSAVIHYSPTNVKNGNLVVKYKFGTF